MEHIIAVVIILLAAPAYSVPEIYGDNWEYSKEPECFSDSFGPRWSPKSWPARVYPDGSRWCLSSDSYSPDIGKIKEIWVTMPCCGAKEDIEVKPEAR